MQNGIKIELDQDEYEIERPICCSVSTFLYTNYIWCIISFGLLILGIVGVTVEQGVLVVLPPAAYFVSISIGLFGLLVISLGIIGQKKSVELCFLLYILLVSLGLIAQTLAYCYLLLYANDVSTISSLDDAAINAQGGFESNLVKYAQSEPAKWIETQNKLKCCGIDFEIGLFKSQAEIDVFESGNKCDDEPEATRVDTLRAAAELLGQDPKEVFEPAQSDDLIGAGTGFFCKDKISLFMVENTPIIAAVLAFILVIQIAALVSAARMYWVPEYIGGWLFDEADLEEVAKRKGLKVPDLPKENAGFTTNLTAATQRLSFRFKNAFTADPNIPKNEGFMNRLSVTRGSAIAFGQPDPKNDPRRNMLAFNPTQNPMGNNTSVVKETTVSGSNREMKSFNQNKAGPPPGMFSRMSQRISLNHFGGGMFSFPKQQPVNTPPGMDQTENTSFGTTKGPPGMTLNSGNFSNLNKSVASNQSKRQPIGPPPLKIPQNSMNLDNFNSSESSTQSNSFSPGFSARRVSQRLQQGLQSLGLGNNGFGFSSPKPPVFPPKKSFNETNTNTNNSSNGFQMNMKTGLPKANAGLNMVSFNSAMTSNDDMTSSESFVKNNPPPPNLRKNTTSQAVPQPKKTAGLSFGGKKNTAPPMSSKPKKSMNAGKSKAVSKKPADGGMGGGLLAQIQMGKQLKHTETDDRSAPKIN